VSARGARKIAKGLGYALAAAVGLVLLVVLVLLLPPVRGRILSEVISRANESLPGVLSVRESGWDLPLSLRLEGLTWTDGPDTLLTAERIHISVRTPPLLNKDVKISNMSAKGLIADVPAVKGRFAGPEAPAKAEPDTSEGDGFPRPGSFPGLPSVSIENFDLSAVSVRLSETASVGDFVAVGGLDLSFGNPPEVGLDRLAAILQTDGPTDGAKVRNATLEVDLDRGLIKGSVEGRLTPDLPLYLSITPTGENAFDLVLTEIEGAAPPDAAGLKLSGVLVRSGRRLTSLSFDALLLTPGTDDLAEIPGLSERLKGLPPLDGLSVSLDGSLDISPTVAASLEAELGPNPWLEGGRLAAAYGGGVLDLDTLLVRLPGLQAGAAGRLSGETIDARCALRVTGTRWLRTFRPEASAPESLAVSLTAEAHGAKASPGLDASLDASARFGGFVLDSLALHASSPGGEDSRVQVDLEALAMDMMVAAKAEIDLSGDPTATLSPIILDYVAAPPGHASRRVSPAPAMITYEREPGSLILDNVSVTGALGDLRLGGKVSASEPGAVRLRWEWPEPPAVLAGTLSPGQLDTLRTDWPEEGPFHIEMDAKVDPDAEGFLTEAEGRLFLPGPRTLAVLLPAGAELDDMGPVRGDLRLKTISAYGGTGRRVTLDLTSTEWIDFARASLTAAAGVTSVDTVGVALNGAKFGLSGILRDGQWDARAEIALPDAGLIRRFSPSVGGGLNLEVTAEADFRGTFDEPNLNASFVGSAASPSYSLPKLVGRARWDGLGLAAKVQAPEGIATKFLSLNEAAASYETGGRSAAGLDIGALTGAGSGTELATAGNPEAATQGDRDREEQIREPGALRERSRGDPGSGAGPQSEEEPEGHSLFPGRLSVSLRGDGLELVHAADIDNPDGWRIGADTLYVKLSNGDLRNAGPFEVLLKPEENLFAVRDLLLSGSLGRIGANGYSCPDSCRLLADALLNLPEEPPMAGVPVGLWPDSLDLSLSSTGRREIAARASVTGIDLGDRSDLRARLELSGAGRSLDIRMAVLDDGVDILDAEGSLPAAITLYPPKASIDEGPVDFEAVLSDFPAPMRDPRTEIPADERNTARLDGRITLGGTTREPSGHMRAQMSFPRWPEMSKYLVHCEASLSSTPGDNPTIEKARPETERATPERMAEPGASRSDSGRPGPELPGGPGLGVAFALTSAEGSLLTGTVSYPVAFSLVPAALRPLDEGEMEVRVDSRALPLEDLDSFLPPNVGLGGTCTLAFKANGPVENPALDGRLAAENFEVSLEDGTRVRSSGTVELSGTGKKPSVEGEVEIHNGVIRVPEKTKDLHPVDGDAVLWEERTGPTINQDDTPPDDTGNATRGGGEGAPEAIGDRAQAQASGQAKAAAGGEAETTGESGAGDAGTAVGERSSPAKVATGGGGADGATEIPTASGADTVAAAPEPPPAREVPQAASGPADADLNLDVTVTIPSGLWIRGRGLDVELGGDLRLVKKGAYPTVSGELQAIGGKLVFLGRIFHVERGQVIFYGGDEINPSLDLALSTNIEGTIVRVLLSGTALEPKLDLTSEPEFSEGDIMSLLVFGRTMDELDNEQMNLLGRRAADIAAAFGAAQLETRLSQQLGVDLVSIGQGTGEEAGTSLTIGKYLSPKVLLKYEQALKDRARFFVNLEYFLTRHFKIETLIGHQNQSAIELNWTSDY
jgi:hypothetical protein